jgi:hypothetical protein
VLEIPPVNSAQAAVKAAIVDEARKQQKGTKRGRPPMPEGETQAAFIPATRCKLNEREAFEQAAKKTV